MAMLKRQRLEKDSEPALPLLEDSQQPTKHAEALEVPPPPPSEADKAELLAAQDWRLDLLDVYTL